MICGWSKAPVGSVSGLKLGRMTPRVSALPRGTHRSEIQPFDEDNGVDISSQLQLHRKVYVDPEQGSPEVIDETYSTQLVDDFDLLPPPPAQLYTRISSLDRVNLDKYRDLGLSVWQLYVRATTLFPPRQIHVTLQEQRFFCRAETKSVFLDRLSAMPGLGEQECALMDKSVTYMGYLLNAPDRFKSDVNSQLWIKACTLDCMLAYWYQTNPVRLQQVMEWLGMGKIDRLRTCIPYRQMWRIFTNYRDNDPELSTSTKPKTHGYRSSMYRDKQKEYKKKLLARGVQPSMPNLPRDFKR